MQISKQQLGWEERCRVWGERPGQGEADEKAVYIGK